MAIRTNNGGRVSLDGNGSSAHDVGYRHLSLEGSNTDIVLNDLTFTNAGNSGGNGGSIFVSNVNLSISGCNFSENSITDYGGAIYAYGASYIAISNSSFVGNDAFYAGGGALCANLYGNGRLVIRNTEFVDNYASYGGGAIKIYGGSTIIENSLVENNSSFDDESDGNGEGISVGNGSLSIQNSAGPYSTVRERAVEGFHPLVLILQ